MGAGIANRVLVVALSALALVLSSYFGGVVGVQHLFGITPNPSGATTSSRHDPNDPWLAWIAPETVCPGSERADQPLQNEVAAMLCLINYARVGMSRALEDRYRIRGCPPSSTIWSPCPASGARPATSSVRSGSALNPDSSRSTHMSRGSACPLKLTDETDPVKAELAVNDLVPPEERGALSLRLILHGRQVCPSWRPRCDVCLLNDICPSAFKIEGAGAVA